MTKEESTALEDEVDHLMMQPEVRRVTIESLTNGINYNRRIWRHGREVSEKEIQSVVWKLVDKGRMIYFQPWNDYYANK